VATVTVYGLTAAPVARRLRVGRPARSRALLVGGTRWVIDLGRALRFAGLEVLMWAGLEEQREQIRQLAAVTQTDTAVPRPGDTIVSLGPVPVAQPADGRAQRTR
jgi:hypothetical protein